MGRIPLSGLVVLALVTATGVAAAPAPGADFGVPCTSEGPAGIAYVQGTDCRSIAIDGYPRQYIAWISASAKQKIDAGIPVPLVVMLHGTGGDGAKFLQISGWREKADAQGLVAVFPSGLTYRVTEPGEAAQVTTKWNSFNLAQSIDPAAKPSGYPAAAPWPADDVSFIRELVADLTAQLPIDASRIYISGFSNGGEMCSRLAIEASDLFAAAGCNAGTLDAAHATAAGNPNMPITLALGTTDDRALAMIQASDPTITEIPLDPAKLQSIQLIATILANTLDSVGLKSSPREDTAAPTSTQLHWAAPAPGNDDGNVFDFLVLAKVEHEYPNGKNNPNHFVMADILWDFFSAHPKDSKAPKTKIEKHPDGRTDSRTVIYKFSSDDKDAKFECKLDAAKFKPCESPKNYRVKPGKHTFSVRAIDSSGNVDPSPAKDKFRAIA